MLNLNKSMTKVQNHELEPDVRNKTFDEVASVYTPEEAIEEARRCLNCKHKPCVGACPVNVRIPEFIEKIVEGKFIEAYEIIKTTNSLPAVCGRVCPQEKQCESVCVRGIKGESVAIGRLERFCADYAMQHGYEQKNDVVKNGIKVAVIGSGPAGLACAGELAKMGYDVKIFESLHTPGGVLTYGIPEFRLPKTLVQDEIDALKKLGVEIEVNSVIGRIATIQELKEEYGFKAVFIATGAGLPKFPGVPGENLNTVFSANEFLTRVNLMQAYKFPSADTPFFVGESCAVIGGGNVAMDAARTAKRLGAKNVYIVYRRGRELLPARLEEVQHAEEEGVELIELSAPVAIHGDENGNVQKLECIRMGLSDETDSRGRRNPYKIEGSNYTIDVNSVIIAIGQTPNPLVRESLQDLEIQPWGGIVTDETGKTNIEGVFAGGDAVSGAATVILAMGAGKTAAKAIDEYIKKG